MKILFLDIDGVVNCKHTKQRHCGFIGIDPAKAQEIKRIIAATGCEVVLSSTWRRAEQDRDEVVRKVCTFIGVTPACWTGRGSEIQAWLDAHPEVTRYAIVDDDTDMLPEQQVNVFATTWEVGITPIIADAIIVHLQPRTSTGECNQ